MTGLEVYMNTTKLQRKIRVAGVAFSLLFGIGILSATTANAQYDRRDDNQNNRRNDRDNDRDYNDRNNDRDYNQNNRNNRNSRNNFIIQQAYRTGMTEGMQDARNGRRANANRAAGQAMRRMNNGDQRNFRQDYREAFIRGYQEGYNRYDNRNDRRYDNNRNRRNGY
jgi:hypothetical protein